MSDHVEIAYDIHSLHYCKIGTGPNIILLHGFGEDQSIWKLQAEFLSKHFTVFSPDLPGSGASAPIAKDTISISDLAIILNKWITAINIQHPVILGHSMGGYVALAYAQLFPNDLKAIGLVHSTIYADSIERKAIRNKSMGFILEHGSAAFLKTSVPGLFKDINNPFVNICIEKGSQIKNEVLIQYQQAMMNRADNSGWLSKQKMPILIIAGIFDQAVSYADSLRQSYVSHQTHFYTLRDSAHMGMLEEPGRVNKILQQFLTGL